MSYEFRKISHDFQDVPWFEYISVFPITFMNSQAFSMLFKISNEFQTVGKSLIFEPVKGKARDEVKPVTG